MSENAAIPVVPVVALVVCEPPGHEIVAVTDAPETAPPEDERRGTFHESFVLAFVADTEPVISPTWDVGVGPATVTVCVDEPVALALSFTVSVTA